MVATVPLTTPVRSLTSARAVAESISVAEPDAPTGQAVDRVTRFLAALEYDYLASNVGAVLDVFDLVTREPALRMAAWLAGHCEDRSAADYWRSMHHLIETNALPIESSSVGSLNVRATTGLRARGVWHRGPGSVIYATFGGRT